MRRKAIAAAALLLLAACGGDDSNPDTVTAPAEKQGPATPTSAADERRAEAALLTLDDFPPGWTATDEAVEPPAESPCKQIRQAEAAVNAHVNGPIFVEGQTVEIEQAVYIYASEDAAESHFAALATGSVRACSAEYIADRLAENVSTAEFKEETTSELAVAPVGSESAAFRVTIPYTSEFFDGEVVVDAVLVRVGRGLFLLTTLREVGPPDDEQRNKLVAVAAQRLDREFE